MKKKVKENRKYWKLEDFSDFLEQANMDMEKVFSGVVFDRNCKLGEPPDSLELVGDGG